MICILSMFVICFGTVRIIHNMAYKCRISGNILFLAVPGVKKHFQKINVYYLIMYLELFATRRCGWIVLYYQLQQDLPSIYILPFITAIVLSMGTWSAEKTTTGYTNFVIYLVISVIEFTGKWNLIIFLASTSNLHFDFDYGTDHFNTCWAYISSHLHAHDSPAFAGLRYICNGLSKGPLLIYTCSHLKVFEVWILNFIFL